ncbi:MAG: endonuclease/exonuclease/phosphatase family protein [Woeseiaceae bacterium]
MTWNVKRNSIFPPDGIRHESFGRIVKAVDPDVIALQEIISLDTDAELTRLMNRYIPLEEGESWHVHTVSDNALISRHPMRWQDGQLVVPYPLPEWDLPGFHFGFAAALVDLPDRFGGTELLVVAMHNKSGADESQIRMRQVQSDAIVSWMRDLRTSTQGHAIADDTPIVILGDMNVVPDASTQPLETLLNGDIVDEETFGPDFSIDWDGTDITDSRPSHNARDQKFYTWRNDNLPFEPSALDRILYTDSVMSTRERFVLNTMTLSPNQLEHLELQQTDVLYGGDPNFYDHLPLIVDFAIGSASLE